VTLDRGTLILVDLEASLGHEQQGTRPCVVLSDAAVNSSQRFPLIAVVPVTATPATCRSGLIGRRDRDGHTTHGGSGRQLQGPVLLDVRGEGEGSHRC
jgi:mRNA-degrading endonuclease toxin of MazEF toxin-antitoxin module